MNTTPAATPTATVTDTLEVDRVTRYVLNPLIARLTRWGISVKGTRILEVRGRVSGEPRTTVVNLLDHEGRRYLVAPRGTTQWVQNLRAAGTGTLRVGRRAETFTAHELDDEAKIEVLRAYLAEWAWEVGKFFGDLRADSPDAEIAAVAGRFPAFRIDT